MLDLSTAEEAIRHEVAGIAARLESLGDDRWEGDTNLPGWTVTDLARHLAWGQQLQADAWHQMRARATDVVLPRAVEATGAALIAELRQANRRFMDELATVTADDLAAACPLPYGTVPAGLVLQVAVMEVGVHHHDLAVSTGAAPDLPPEVVTAGVALVPVLLATPATEAAPDATSYRLGGDRLDVVVRRRADGWAIADGSAPVTCSIGGADDALLLFILGRLAPNDGRLTVSDAGQAAMFKRYFPGP